MLGSGRRMPLASSALGDRGESVSSGVAFVGTATAIAAAASAAFLAGWAAGRLAGGQHSIHRGDSWWGYVFDLGQRRKNRLRCEDKRDKPEAEAKTALEALIGDTPLVELRSLSAATGCRIFGKCEFVNHGGSVKDRVALELVREGRARGHLPPRTSKASGGSSDASGGGALFEGTSGSTGISLALVCKAEGLKCCIYMPDDQAKEKSDVLESLGANVNRVRPVSIIDPEQYSNLAEDNARRSGGYYADQFENAANMRAHYKGTGPEIWEQTGGRIDAFICACGTGGTLAGVSRCLKERSGGRVRCFLVDPPGSSLYNRVRHGVAYAPEEAEGTRSRHQVDTITEGIGINRLTNNFLLARVDDAFKATDQEAVDMAGFLLEREGIFVGSSSAINCVGAVKTARKLGPGHTIVTILCDHGQRHISRFHNPDYLEEAGLRRARFDDSLEFVL